MTFGLVGGKRCAPLGFPTRRDPGIDPDHIGMSHGQLRFSCVANGSGFIQLYPVPGVPGTVNGSATSSGVISFLGTGINCTGGGSTANTAVTWTGGSLVNDLTQTMAAIVYGNAFASGGSWIVGTQSNQQVGYSMYVHGTPIILLIEFGGGFAQIQSNLTINTQTPYFLAASVNAATSSNVVVNFVAMNLANGVLVSQQVVGTGVAVASLGTTTVGNITTNSNGSQFQGYICAASMTSGFMSIPELSVWANDPWAFWYPAESDKLFSEKAGFPTSGATVQIL